MQDIEPIAPKLTPFVETVLDGMALGLAHTYFSEATPGETPITSREGLLVWNLTYLMSGPGVLANRLGSQFAGLATRLLDYARDQGIDPLRQVSLIYGTEALWREVADVETRHFLTGEPSRDVALRGILTLAKGTFEAQGLADIEASRPGPERFLREPFVAAFLNASAKALAEEGQGTPKNILCFAEMLERVQQAFSVAETTEGREEEYLEGIGAVTQKLCKDPKTRSIGLALAQPLFKALPPEDKGTRRRARGLLFGV